MKGKYARLLHPKSDDYEDGVENIRMKSLRRVYKTGWKISGGALR